MEESTTEAETLEDTLLREEDIDCDFNTNSNSDSLMASSRNENSNDEVDSNKEGVDVKRHDEEEENIFNSDMDVFESNDFLRNGSPSSDNLELDKIMEQLEDTLAEDIFATGDLNSEMLQSIDEVNASNGDVNLDFEGLTDIGSMGENDESNTVQLDAIDLINKELDDTLQFTDVLCDYIYSDIIIGKDFFKLFSADNVKSAAVVVGDCSNSIADVVNGENTSTEVVASDVAE